MTPPQTPSTLNELREARRLIVRSLTVLETASKRNDEARNLMANAVKLLEEVERAVRFVVEPISKDVRELRSDVDRLNRAVFDTEPAPAMGGE